MKKNIKKQQKFWRKITMVLVVFFIISTMIFSIPKRVNAGALGFISSAINRLSDLDIKDSWIGAATGGVMDGFIKGIAAPLLVEPESVEVDENGHYRINYTSLYEDPDMVAMYGNIEHPVSMLNRNIMALYNNFYMNESQKTIHYVN